jgi:hypothetical protein
MPTECPLNPKATNPWPGNTAEYFAWEDRRAIFLNGRAWGSQKPIASKTSA